MINVNVNDEFRLEDILNIDKTPVFLNDLGKYSWDIKRTKYVQIIKNNKEKNHFIFTVGADSSIFRGKSKCCIYTQLNTNPYVKNGKYLFPIIRLPDIP